jgi:3-phenylpropionate/cinnamic acid dioxygenase small subunit
LAEGVTVRTELLSEIEQFLYREARLLDERRFEAWLALFTDDVRYWMPVRMTRYPRRSKAIAVLDPDRHVEEELGKASDLAIFDETKETLCRRVARLDTGMAWAEDPPSRTRHIVSNVEVEPGETEAELRIYSNFVVYRNRGESEQDFYVGARQDTLRNVDGAWKIARRTIVLDQNVLLAKNVSIFF